MMPYPLVVGSAIIIGLTMLVSGTGKLPGQTEFIDALLKSFWTPSIAYFIGYCLPWVETGLGVLLLIGVLPRIAAALCIPLTAGFIANNFWAIANSIENFPECASCFGIWEKWLGSLSSTGALMFDIVLLFLALNVLACYREGLLTIKPWFIIRKKRQAS